MYLLELFAFIFSHYSLWRIWLEEEHRERKSLHTSCPSEGHSSQFYFYPFKALKPNIIFQLGFFKISILSSVSHRLFKVFNKVQEFWNLFNGLLIIIISEGFLNKEFYLKGSLLALITVLYCFAVSWAILC
jgi:hypothetical protein